MKRFSIMCLMALAFISIQAFAQGNKKTETKGNTAETKIELKTMLDTVSYIIGTDVAFTLKNNQMELNPDAFAKGFSEAWKGVDSLFTREQAESIMVKYGETLRTQREQESAGKFAETVAAGKAFLEENGKREGVVTTESGLQYEILVQGTGEKPTASNIVNVHYKGTLLDGYVFDSSYDRGEPIEFELGRLIPGWVEGIQLMPVGSKYKFFVPSELGYGAREAGAIPPHSVLIFEVELLGFK